MSRRREDVIESRIGRVKCRARWRLSAGENFPSGPWDLVDEERERGKALNRDGTLREFGGSFGGSSASPS